MGFAIKYMINLGFHFNRTFRDEVEKCIYTIFSELTQPFIKATFSKKNTSLLALIMLHDTRA